MSFLRVGLKVKLYFKRLLGHRFKANDLQFHLFHIVTKPFINNTILLIQFQLVEHLMGLKSQLWWVRANLCPYTQNDLLITVKQLCFYLCRLTWPVSLFFLLARYMSLNSLRKSMKWSEVDIASSKHINQKQCYHVKFYYLKI